MSSPSNSNQKITQAETWQEWAKLAQGGNKQVYNQLLRDIAPFIRGYILPTLSNADWADDITQDVLISVHKSLRTYSPKFPFKPWLIAIINFRRTDFLRKHYAKRGQDKTSLDNPEFLKNYVTNPVHAGEYKDVEDALATLPKVQSDIFKKMKIEGYTAKEIANQLGMSESAVKVSAHRTIKKIQDMLA